MTRQTAFRGTSPGDTCGPYLSQFLLIGNASLDGTTRATDGYINYGAQQIDQRVPEAEVGDDYMMNWDDWYDVQQGYEQSKPGQTFINEPRFIYTPRDLATYVHFDALYQAYLNAALILLANGTPFDPNFDHLSGASDHHLMYDPLNVGKVRGNTGGFALYGGGTYFNAGD